MVCLPINFGSMRIVEEGSMTRPPLWSDSAGSEHAQRQESRTTPLIARLLPRPTQAPAAPTAPKTTNAQA